MPRKPYISVRLRTIFFAAALLISAASGCRDWFLPEGEPPTGPIVNLETDPADTPLGREAAVNRAADGLTGVMLGTIPSGTVVAVKSNSAEAAAMANKALRGVTAFIAVKPVAYPGSFPGDCVLHSNLEGRNWTLKLTRDNNTLYTATFTLH